MTNYLPLARQRLIVALCTATLGLFVGACSDQVAPSGDSVAEFDSSSTDGGSIGAPDETGLSTGDISTAATSTTISPGQSIQSAVNAYPAGTAFTIKAGVHRLQGVTPKNGDSFTGEAGAVLVGARLLTSFTRSGSYWVASGQTQEGERIPPKRSNGVTVCLPEYPRCNYPEDLFFDNLPLRHVASLSAVGAGRWYFDYGADKIYFADNPSGRKVEASVTPHAFTGRANNVTIKGLVIEKYASPSQDGAIDGMHGDDWVVSDNEMRWNHGTGVKLGDRVRVLRNNTHHNGHLGMNASGAIDALVEDNEIAYNNTAGMRAIGFSGGGAKFSSTLRLTVRGNRVHNNTGKGLWTDIDNRYTVYENNIITNNDLPGIFHEVSYDVIIRNNTLDGNGFKVIGTIRGGGIAVTSSPNVEMYGNTIRNNQHGIAVNQDNRGSGPYGLHEVRNLYVHDNNITMSRGYTGLGLGQGVSDRSYYTSKNNRFVNNTYTLGSGGKYFYWQDDDRTTSEWKAYGQDASGSFR